MNKRIALVLGIPSGIVTLGGVLVAVLLHVVLSEIDDGFIGEDNSIRKLTSAEWPLWVIGFGYIIPGFFGLLSALIQNKGLYIASIVITILLLKVMTGVTILSGVILFMNDDDRLWMNSEDCHDVDKLCVCREYDSIHTLSRSCSSYKSINSLSVAVMFFLVFTWIAKLVLCVLCCYYTCCANTGGVQGNVIATANQPQPMIVFNHDISSASAQNLPPANVFPRQFPASNKEFTGI